MQEKENSMPWHNNKYKEAKKVNEKSKKTIYLCTLLFDTLVTSISEYSIKPWDFKGLKKLEKQTDTRKLLQIYLKRETVDSRQFCLWRVK